MKRLLLALLLVGCSSNVTPPSVDSAFIGRCHCAANAYNADMEISPSSFICTLIHKTERAWQVELSNEQLKGIQARYSLKEFKKAPQYEACMKKLLPGYRYKWFDASAVDEADEKCSLKVFGSLERRKHTCWGF